MSSVRLEFPVLVRAEEREGRRSFVVRPLLIEGPEGEARRFEDALHKCLQAVRALFKSFKSERKTIDTLLWYRFNPELESKRFRLEFASGAKKVYGEIHAAWFDHDSLRYVCLPGFGGHLFVLPPRPRYRMEEEVELAVKHLLRQERKEKGDDAPAAETHFAAEREFVTGAEAVVQVKGEQFPFEQAATRELFQALLGESGSFSGAAEIEQVARDLTVLAPEERLRAVGMDELAERLGRLLFEEDPVPTVIVGPPGVGKTSLVHEAVARLIEAQPRTSIDRLPKLWHLDPNRVIAGQRVVGMWQNRMEAILTFVRTRLRDRYKVQRPDALFVDNPVALLRVGKSAQNEMTLGDLLKPWLEKRAIGLLLEATPEAWKATQELDRGFADLFRVLRVSEPGIEEALRVAARQRMRLERDLRCRIDGNAIGRLLEYHRAWPGGRALPGGIVGPLKAVAGKHRGGAVGAHQVDEAFRARSRLATRIFHPGLKLSEEEVRTALEARLVGQPEAVRCLVDTVHLAKARVGDPERPLASLLFIGPTGVGKTEAAKALARYLFDDPDSLVRFDMNEYVDGAAVARLIGGYGRPEGRLTERVRHRPFSVLLFDEIEKADPAVHDLLLQVLGEGRLSDSLGRVADFSGCVIILTSNLGAGEARRTVGFGEAEASRAAAYRKAVEDFFRPEFVNRIDRIVDFRPLVLEDVEKIARLQVERFLERDGFLRRQSFLTISPRALRRVAEAGFDPEMGGRALKRSLEKEVALLAAERLNALPPDDPLLLEVFRRGTSLVPRVTPLPLAARPEGPPAWSAPGKCGLRDFYRGLLEISRELEGEAKAGGPSALKARISEMRQRLSERVFQIEERPPRVLATSDGGRREGSKMELEDLREAFARLDLRGYLDEMRRAPEMKGAEAGARRDFVELAALDQAQRSRAAGRRGGTCAHLRSLIGQPGQAELIMLAGGVRTWLELFDPHTEKDDVLILENDAFVCLRELDLTAFLSSEAGTHLFYPAHQRGVPLALRLLELPEGMSLRELANAEVAAGTRRQNAFEAGEGEEPEAPGPVVRVYCPPGPGTEGTVTDVRTREALPWWPSAEDWFLWVYSALPATARIVFDE